MKAAFFILVLLSVNLVVNSAHVGRKREGEEVNELPSEVKKCGWYLSEKARRFIQQALEDDEYANEIFTAGHLIEGKIKKAKEMNPSVLEEAVISDKYGNAGDLEPIKAILGATKISDEQGYRPVAVGERNHVTMLDAKKECCKEGTTKECKRVIRKYLKSIRK